MKTSLAEHLKLIDSRPRDRRAAAGFTLVEVLMAIAILSVIFGTVYRTFDLFNRSYTSENVKAGVQQKTLIGLEIMVQDIRMAGLDPLGTAGAGIVAASATSIQFTADLNYDGDLDDPFENIVYTLNGSKLQQTNHLGTETLLDDVSGLTFTYLDANDAAAASLNDIKTVAISLSMQKAAGRSGRVNRVYTTRVRCRNL